jgi:hypothetical protein
MVNLNNNLHLNQPLEDLITTYYEYIDSIEDSDEAEFDEAVSTEEFIDLEGYLIHMDVI